jgi:hypothetical protein
VVRARYDFADAGAPTLGTVVDQFVTGRATTHDPDGPA